MSFFSPRRFCVAVLLSVAALCTAVRAADAKRPNIIFVEVDDLTYTFAGPWGSKTAQTPTLDKLAAAGFVFDQAMCQGTMCGPSRNSLVSGLYPHQLGFYQNGDVRKLPEKAWMFPAAIRRAGYTTAWVGKSHLKPYFTKKGGDSFNSYFGFDYSLHTLGRALVGDDDEGGGGKGEEGGNADKDGPNPYMQHLADSKLFDQYKADVAAHRNSTLPEDDYLDGWFTKNAEQYIAAYKSDKPLFLWLNYSVPHGPYDVADPYHKPFASAAMPGMTKPENFTHPKTLIERTKSYRTDEQAATDQRGFFSNIFFMDRQVQRILDALQQKKMLDDAWIVFFSDHGVMAGAQGLIHKHTLYRPVTQPSLIIRPPAGASSSTRIAQPIELLDLLPTFLEIAGSTEKAPNGLSIRPLFSGGKIDRPYTFAEIEKWIAVSDGRYRLIHSLAGEPDFLFDDSVDPQNLKDIAKEHPDIVKRLQQAIDDWTARSGKRLPSKSL